MTYKLVIFHRLRGRRADLRDPYDRIVLRCVDPDDAYGWLLACNLHHAFVVEHRRSWRLDAAWWLAATAILLLALALAGGVL